MKVLSLSCQFNLQNAHDVLGLIVHLFRTENTKQVVYEEIVLMSCEHFKVLIHDTCVGEGRVDQRSQTNSRTLCNLQ